MKDDDNKAIDVDTIEDIVDPTETQTVTPIPEWDEEAFTGTDEERVAAKAEHDQAVKDATTAAEEADKVAKAKPAFTERTADIMDDDADDAEGDEGGDTDIDPTGEFFKGVTDVLAQKGLIAAPEEPITSEEDFATHIQKDMDAKIEARVKKAEEYMKSGVPYSVVNQIETAITEAASITEESLGESPELAKSLIKGEFLTRGFSEEQADGYVSMFETNGVLVEEGMKSLDLRKAGLDKMLADEIKKGTDKAAQDAIDYQKQLKELEESISKPEIFKSKIAPSTIEKVRKTLNTVVGYDKDGAPLNAIMKYKLENPVDFEHKLLYLFTATNGFQDLNNFNRSAETRISRQFRDSVNLISSDKSFVDNSSTPGKTKIDVDSIDDIV
jgi:orotate phosphoribosyltransferase-like protein